MLSRMEMDVDQHRFILFERAKTFEDMANRVGEVMKEQADQGNVVSSLSHAVDHDDPKGPYQFIVVTEPIIGVAQSV
jgi:hypothetical protein